MGDLPYLTSTRAKGKVYWYYRRGGRRYPIGKAPGEPGFGAAYDAIHATFEDGQPVERGAPGSIQRLVIDYLDSAEYRQLGQRTKTEYRAYLEAFRETFGDLQITTISRRVIRTYRDTMADTPAKANNTVKVLRLWLEWCLDGEYIATNPASKLKKLKTGDGWQPWPQWALNAFAEQSKGISRTAFFLALYTGQRQGDVRAMRWNQIQDGKIKLKQSKTGKELIIPLHPVLAEQLATVQRKGLTILGTRSGQPVSETNFKSQWRREMERIALSGHVFHGLRKNATVFLLEAGCTEAEVSSITGMSLEMVMHYGKGVNQERLAEVAMDKWATKNGSTDKPSGKE